MKKTNKSPNKKACKREVQRLVSMFFADREQKLSYGLLGLQNREQRMSIKNGMQPSQ